jgi:capsular exopolysaccharide synthesis family protein
MLNIVSPKADPPTGVSGSLFADPLSATAPFTQEPRIDLLELFRLVGRQMRLIGAVTVLFVLLALVYLAFTDNRYTASSTLLIDPRQLVPLSASPSANAAIDSAYVDSAVEILRSDQTAKSVVSKLKLRLDPEFVRPPGLLRTILNAVLGLFSAPDKPGEYELLSLASTVLQSKLTVKRTGLTYVIQVDYQSLDPDKAARIANAVVEAYMVEQLESKYETARQTGSWLQQRIADLKAKAEAAEQAAAEFKSKAAQTIDDPAEVAAKNRTALTDLESSARISRNLYESLLSRATEATQQQSIPIDPARVIVPASPPLERSHPKSLLILGAASILGLFGGLVAAYAREHLNIVFRLPSQVERELGIRCVCTIPMLPHQVRQGRRSRARLANRFSPGSVNVFNQSQLTYREGSDQYGNAKDRPACVKNPFHLGRRRLARDDYAHAIVVDRSFTAFNETLRFIGAEFTSLGPRHKVIGISSAHPREGKSMVAVTLAQLLADAGRKTLLIDCDLRNMGLTRQLAPSAKAGLGEVLGGRPALNELLWSDDVTKLDFLPAVLPAVRVAHPAALLSSAATKNLIKAARDTYDHVILDLPPILPVADTKAISPFVDSFIMVIEWGETRVSAVSDALNIAPLVAEKLLGAVLAKARSGLFAQLRSRKLEDLYSAVKASSGLFKLRSRKLGELYSAVLARWK